jgi:hypothetical protein
MTDPVTILVAERVLERAVIAFFAGISMILGYSLFRAGIITQQQGEGEWGKLKIKLLSVGPGVFFALFGTIVMIILVVHGLSLPTIPVTSSIANSSEKDSAESIKYGTATNSLEFSSISSEDAQAITTVLVIVQSRRHALNLTSAQQDAFDRALSGLEQLRKAAAYKRFPAVASKYKDWSDRASVNPHFVDSLSAEEKKEFVEMRAFLNDSYLSGGQQ